MLRVLSVKADVIWTPEDSFFLKHEAECIYVNRVFTANGPDGIVILYKSPELPVETARWENGFQARIDFTYEDSEGIVWGIYEYGDTSGWVPMEYMDVVYDGVSFEEEYGDQIEEQDGILGEACQGREIYSWPYPGAEKGSLLQMEDDYDYMPNYYQVFVDEKGYRWGKVKYYLGHKNFWICLDQPEADFEQLYPDGVPQRGKSTADTGNRAEKDNRQIVPKMNAGMVSAAVSMVVLVVLVTAVLLVRLKKGKKG